MMRKMRKVSADGSSYWVPMLGSAIRILEAFYNSEFELSLHEVAAIAKVGKTSAFRILYTLDRLEYVEKNPSNGKYRLGLKLMSAARQALSGQKLAQVARPYLLELRDEFDETTNLAALRKEQIIYLDIYESRHSFRMTDTVGSILPWHSTALGKSIAAFLPRDTVNSILKRSQMKQFTPYTISTIREYIRGLERVRERGYSLDDEETELGASCVSAPILSDNETVIGALSISGPSPRIQEKQKKIILGLRKAASAISKVMSLQI